MLPQKIYEALRWIISIVLPAVGALIVSLNEIWGLGWPAKEIGLTLDVVGVALGAIFGISKVVNDKKK
jgi:hypothetical protein